MALENRSWGYTRIQGALPNLGYDVGRGTIANVLSEHGIDPAPDRGKRTSWSTFLKALGCLALAEFGVGFAPYAVFLVGLAVGAEVDIMGYLIARYFGLRSYGALYGLMYTTFMLGTSLSQMGASIVFDNTGSYHLFLMAAAACLLTGSVIAMFLPRFDALAARLRASRITADV